MKILPPHVCHRSAQPLQKAEQHWEGHPVSFALVLPQTHYQAHEKGFHHGIRKTKIQDSTLCTFSLRKTIGNTTGSLETSGITPDILETTGITAKTFFTKLSHNTTIALTIIYHGHFHNYLNFKSNF